MNDWLSAPDREPGSATEKPRQRRSEQRRGEIEAAAIAIIGRQGISRLTHRAIAREAKVPLAATTYHYKTGKDIIAASSELLLRSYANDYDRLYQRLEAVAELRLEHIVLRTVMGGVGKHRTATLAWCEIMLNCARDEGGQALARKWFDTVLEIWTNIASETDSSEPASDAQSAIDTITGMLLITLPLDVSDDEIAAVMRPGGAALSTWAPVELERILPGTEARDQKRGDITRDKIVAAAAAIIAESGMGEVTLRKVAARAGVSPAAPSYYFPSAHDLLNATLSQLFENSKDRYREAMSAGMLRPADIDQLADLTAAVFFREATEFRAVALAGYPLHIEAARQPSLRGAAWGAVEDQSKAWAGQLTSAGIESGQRCGLLAQSLFLGKLVRMLATRASTNELAGVRRQFAEDFAAMRQGRHWARNWYI